jgi:formate dehydrogenase subunit gamma
MPTTILRAVQAALLAILLLDGPGVVAQEGPPGAGQDPDVPRAPGLYQIPGQNAPQSKDEVELFIPAEDQIIGRVSIPDQKLATLVQPEGRDWRVFRTRTSKWIVAVVTLGMLGALTAFYLWRGRIYLEHGRSGRWLPRFNLVERFTHWTTAVSFIVLALTGLVITFGRPLLIPLIGHPAFTQLSEVAKYLHNFTSFAFVLGLVLMFVLWVRDNLPTRADLHWVRHAGGLFKPHSTHPETGRFNAGQKMVFWGVILGGGALAVTGYALMAPFYFTGVSGMQIVHVIHTLLAGVMIAAIFAHIYIGSLGMEGAFDAMGRGEVDETWAMEHHRGWYDQLRRQRPRPPARRPVRPAYRAAARSRSGPIASSSAPSSKGLLYSPAKSRASIEPSSPTRALGSENALSATPLR